MKYKNNENKWSLKLGTQYTQLEFYIFNNFIFYFLS